MSYYLCISNICHYVIENIKFFIVIYFKFKTHSMPALGFSVLF